MWDDKYGCKKMYYFIYAIHLISYIYLEFCITIDRSVGAPFSGNYVVGGTNSIDKRILKLEMTNILNH